MLDMWKSDPVTTEATAYEVLKDIESYYGIPWAPLLNSGKLYTTNSLEEKSNSFTVCQHIRYKEILNQCVFLNITKVYTPHCTDDFREYNGVKIEPFAHYPVNSCRPEHNKDILFSFIGAENTHWTRKYLAENLKHDSRGYVCVKNGWHFDQKARESNAVEFYNIMARSKFSLCPRGTGPGTIRFWEAIESNSIPVMICDGLTLPEGMGAGIIQVSEDKEDIVSIPERLAAISDEEINMMLEVLGEFTFDKILERVKQENE